LPVLKFGQIAGEKEIEEPVAYFLIGKTQGVFVKLLIVTRDGQIPALVENGYGVSLLNTTAVEGFRVYGNAAGEIPQVEIGLL
jgi:hypothetical protein